MRLEADIRPRPGHLHVVEAKLAGKAPGTRMRGAVGRWTHGRFQDPGLRPQRRFSSSAALVTSVKTLESLGQKARLPAGDEEVAATKTLTYLAPGQSRGQEQDESRAHPVTACRRGRFLKGVFAYDYGD